MLGIFLKEQKMTNPVNGPGNNNSDPKIPNIENHQQNGYDNIVKMIQELNKKVDEQNVEINIVKEDNANLRRVNEETQAEVRQMREEQRKLRITTGASLGMTGGFLLSSFLHSSPVNTLKNVLVLSAIGVASGDGYHRVKTTQHLRHF